MNLGVLCGKNAFCSEIFGVILTNLPYQKQTRPRGFVFVLEPENFEAGALYVTNDT
jgi:hypothetical protein